MAENIDLCRKEFVDFLRIISNVVYPISVSLCAKAFESLTGLVPIGKVEAIYIENPNLYNRLSEPSKTVISVFTSPEGYNEKNYLVREISTKKHDNTQFIFYCLSDNDFDKKDAELLDIITNVLFMALGKSRLIQISENQKLMDLQTGLPNVFGFFRHCKNICGRNGYIGYTFVYFNIKNVKAINDKITFAEGTKVIMKYINILLSALYEDETIARLGGDNFTAVIRANRTEFFKELLSDTLVGYVGEKTSTRFCISSRAGFYEVDNPTVSCNEALDIAASVYSLVRSENTVFFNYTDDVYEMLSNKKRFISMFEPAIEEKKIKVYYQPKTNIHTNAIVGAEALSRWDDNGVIIPPYKFIPCLEQEGLICKLDMYVLDTVCQNLSDWIKAGVEPVTISVNFSRLHLQNTFFVDEIVGILGKYNIDPSLIEIEFTETTSLDDFTSLRGVVIRLRDHGIKTSIDDFGTGYSSLNLVKDLSVDVLKMDKSFLHTSNSKFDRNRIVMKNIINMATELGMDILAEGVETYEQIEFLSSINCDTVQGFYFDKPMPMPNFTDKLKNKIYTKYRR